ncbi:MAG: translocation/assembly module TamB domain-containing protein, partial [Bacteroidales bacterium]|nr:translocation/assembly module TamB domain-containing protein [Bacteroidales bacterium]
SFSYSNASLYSIGASNYYNVLTSSLSSWLSQISKDFDVGVRYTPEDNLTAEELEVALSTQLFDDKLTIEGNLGMYTGSHSDMAGGANNIVGDVDITYKFTNRLSLKIYNHSNLNSNYYLYSYETYSDYTQGIGISYSQSFDNIREIFVRKNRNKKNKNNKR